MENFKQLRKKEKKDEIRVQSSPESRSRLLCISVQSHAVSRKVFKDAYDYSLYYYVILIGWILGLEIFFNVS